VRAYSTRTGLTPGPPPAGRSMSDGPASSSVHPRVGGNQPDRDSTGCLPWLRTSSPA